MEKIRKLRRKREHVSHDKCCRVDKIMIVALNVHQGERGCNMKKKKWGQEENKSTALKKKICEATR